MERKKIICLIVKSGIPQSKPMILSIGKSKKVEWILDELIHELIHRIYCQKGNISKSKISWEYIFEKYKNEKWNTQIHSLCSL